MSQMFPELEVISITVGEGTRERHIDAIRETLVETQPVRKRFRLMAVAIAAVFLIPVLALAAEQSQPGDFLYPIRQVIPWTTDVDVTNTEPTPDRLSQVGDSQQSEQSVIPSGSSQDRQNDEVETVGGPDRADGSPVADRHSDLTDDAARGGDDEPVTRSTLDPGVGPADDPHDTASLDDSTHLGEADDATRRPRNP